jgi:hypothetical protein
MSCILDMVDAALAQVPDATLGIVGFAGDGENVEGLRTFEQSLPEGLSDRD